MSVDLIFAILAAGLLVIGLIGTVMPVLPGAPLAWAGLLLGYFSIYVGTSILGLIITGIFALFVSIADNIFPTLLTKKSGGSKYGTWGSVIGLMVGFFIGPAGIILGPFAGALIGELINDSSDFNKALKAALGAFEGFLLGTGLKMITVMGFIWYFIIMVMRNLK